MNGLKLRKTPAAKGFELKTDMTGQACKHCDRKENVFIRVHKYGGWHEDLCLGCALLLYDFTLGGIIL